MRQHRVFTRDAHRYLDGEPGGELDAAERAAAERLLARVRAYAERLQPPAASLDDAVMAAVRHPGPARGGAWSWLVEPRAVRVRPVWIPALAAAAALALWLVPSRPAPRAPELGSRVVAGPDTVYVRFELVAPQARTVSVAGSFNGWQVGALPLARVEDGLWATTVALPVGEHRYEFVIDGTRWVPDPTAHAQVDDGFGGQNSVIVVGPKGLVRS